MRREAPGYGPVFRAALKRLRARRGLTVADIAEALDVDQRTFERFAAGRTRLELPRLFALAELLDADPLGLIAALRLRDASLAEVAAEPKVLLALALALARLTPTARQRLAGATAIDVADACERFLQELTRTGDGPRSATWD